MSAAISSVNLDMGLPSNVSAERMILGGDPPENDSLYEAKERLESEDFSLDSHRRLFRHMTALGVEGHAIDLITLAHDLANCKELETIGGVVYLSSLTEGLPRRPVIQEYIRIVKDKAMLRNLMVNCSAAINRASDQGETALQIASWLTASTSTLMDGAINKATVFSSADLVEAAEGRLMRPSADAGQIPFGITALDRLTNGGIRLGELWIDGAAPARGKTSFARQVTCHTVLAGIPAYVHSGEMTKESWVDISACLIEEVPAWKVRDPYLLNLADKERLQSGLRTLSKLPLYISDVGGIELDRLIFNAIRAKVKHDIQLLVVDYAQIIKAPGGDKKDQVSAVAGRLREFAKEYNVATILLSQLARPEGRNINARPNMFSLKESGALEEAAHGVILNYMPVDPETNVFTGQDELIIGKQRFGPVGSALVEFNGELRDLNRDRRRVWENAESYRRFERPASNHAANAPMACKGCKGPTVALQLASANAYAITALGEFMRQLHQLLTSRRADPARPG